MQHSASIHPLRRFWAILRVDLRYYFCGPKGYTPKINWSKVVNYRARKIQIRMPGCRRITQICSGQSLSWKIRRSGCLWQRWFWSIRSSVPEIWIHGVVLFVSRVSSVLLRCFTCPVMWGCCTCMRAFFRKTHCRLISAILNFFECSDRRHVCCVDGPDFGILWCSKL